MDTVKYQNVKIDLGAVQETLILPLWARAKEMEKKNPIIYDSFARDIVAKIDYDFSKIAAGQAAEHQIVWALRAYNFDRIAKFFMAQNKNVLVVNIGAGLDTMFRRVDNGSVRWINLELPDVADLRRKLIPDSERQTTIAKSVFDFTWADDIAEKRRGCSVMFVAAGVLCYFEAREVELLFRKLAEKFPSAHFIFDAMSWFTVWGSNRQIMKSSGMDSSAILKWHLKRASKLKRWVATIRVIEEYPLLSRFPARNDLNRKMIWALKITGLFRLYNMIHVQF